MSSLPSSTTESAMFVPKDQWETNFVKWLQSILPSVNPNRGTTNCASCSIILNDILNNGLPSNFAPAPVVNYSVVYFDPHFNQAKQIDKVTTANATMINLCQVKSVDLGDFVEVAEESQGSTHEPQYRFRLIPKTELGLQSEKQPKVKKFIPCFSTTPQNILHDLTFLPRRQGKLNIGFVNASTSHGFIFVYLKGTGPLRKSHLYNFIVGPNNQVLFIDAQANTISRTIDTSIYTEEIFYLASVPPEKFQAMNPINLQVKKEQKGHFDIKVKQEMTGSLIMTEDAQEILRNDSEQGQRIIQAIRTNNRSALKALVKHPDDLNKAYLISDWETARHFNQYETPLFVSLFTEQSMVEYVISLGARIRSLPFLLDKPLRPLLERSRDPRYNIISDIIEVLEDQLLLEVGFETNHDEPNFNYIKKEINQCARALICCNINYFGTLSESDNYSNLLWRKCDIKARSLNLLFLAVLSGSIKNVEKVFSELEKNQDNLHNIDFIFTTEDTHYSFTDKSNNLHRTTIYLFEIAALSGYVEMFVYLTQKYPELYTKTKAFALRGAIQGGQLHMIRMIVMQNPGLLYERIPINPPSSSKPQALIASNSLNPSSQDPLTTVQNRLKLSFTPQQNWQYPKLNPDVHSWNQALLDKTSLMLAVEEGNDRVVDSLLELDSKHPDEHLRNTLLGRKTNDDYNVLFHALASKQPKMVKKLLHLAPFILYETDTQGKTALMFACSIPDSTELINVLWEMDQILRKTLFHMTIPADKFPPDKTFFGYDIRPGMNVYHFLALNGNVEGLKKCLKYMPLNVPGQSSLQQSSYYAQDKLGCNQMHVAIAFNKKEYVEFLWNEGDPNRILFKTLAHGRYNALFYNVHFHDSIDIFKFFLTKHPHMINGLLPGKVNLLMLCVTEGCLCDIDFKNETAFLEKINFLLSRMDPHVIFEPDSEGNTVFDYIQSSRDKLKKSIDANRDDIRLSTLNNAEHLIIAHAISLQEKLLKAFDLQAAEGVVNPKQSIALKVQQIKTNTRALSELSKQLMILLQKSKEAMEKQQALNQQFILQSQRNAQLTEQIRDKKGKGMKRKADATGLAAEIEQEEGQPSIEGQPSAKKARK